ncbi:3-oxoacyl-[acyl-carrier- ] reductase -like [Olea europaea subsp. europaea]|uniref:3-oxoacyl-[acyl-carrier- ] reductase -like n=1 Tax=Olea europaea subsp. europaea TaxID=158383 RepID=A0A8S0UDT1_OLEEU|nr:3-oxoacyl-[acyl-carrier- ] reductase -like [Olea europaea subsp. europaea]
MSETPDEVAIVTGSASGIGRGTALAFAALNYRLVLVDKNAERLAETGALCAERSARKHKPLELALDISTGEHVARQVVASTLEKFGQLDVLINNAGITALTRFDDPKCVDLYHKIIATNMHAVVYLCLASFEALKQSRGSIVNVSSVLDDKPANHKFAYCMSKAGVTMLTKCLANDFGPHVRVNSVSPGPVASSILDDMGINLSERETNAKSTTLVGRIGRPEEVAKMIIHLASKDKSAFITGSRVLVDGGYTIRPSGID